MGPRLVHVPDEQEGRGCIRLWELHDQCGTNGDYGIAVARAGAELTASLGLVAVPQTSRSHYRIALACPHSSQTRNGRLPKYSAE
jgi:hypothetical protein